MSTKTRIALTGPTGGLGSSVLKHILTFIDDPSRLIICQYNPNKPIEEIASRGLEVRRADYNDPSTMDTAFAGAQILFLVSYPSIEHEQRVRPHRNAIDAAKRVGVKRIVYTSLGFAGLPSGTRSEAHVMRAHLDTEAYLKQSGLEYTIVREALYTEVHFLYLGFFDAAKDTEGIVRTPSDGGRGVAFALRDELGEGTARLLVHSLPDGGDPDRYKNTTILLTGPAAISITAAADAMSSTLGRPLQVEFLGDEDFILSPPAVAMSNQMGEGFARKWGTSYKAFRDGECEVVDPTLERLLGRKPMSYADGLAKILKR